MRSGQFQQVNQQINMMDSIIVKVIVKISANLRLYNTRGFKSYVEFFI